MANKKDIQTIREKSIDELVVYAAELSDLINDQRVKSYFSDQTSVNDVKSNKVLRARVLTVLTEKRNAVTNTETEEKGES